MAFAIDQQRIAFVATFMQPAASTLPTSHRDRDRRADETDASPDVPRPRLTQLDYNGRAHASRQLGYLMLDLLALEYPAAFARTPCWTGRR